MHAADLILTITGALLSTEFMPPADGTPEFRAGLSYETGVGAGGADAVFAVNDGNPIQRQDGYGNGVLVNHFSDFVDFAGALGGDDNGRQFVAIIDPSLITPLIAEFDPANANSLLNVFASPAAVSNVAGPNWALIGDAAACVSPLNGEGIDYGLETGRLVAEHLASGTGLGEAWRSTLVEHYGEAFSIARRLEISIGQSTYRRLMRLSRQYSPARLSARSS